MSCPHPVELSRALIAGIDDRLRAHLEICTHCSDEIEAHAAVARDVQRVPVVEPPHDHARSVRASLMAAARVPAPVARVRFAWAFAAGALAAAAVLAFVLLRKPADPAQTVAMHDVLLPHEGAALMRIASAEGETVRVAHGTVSVDATHARGKRVRMVTGDAELDGDGGFDVSVDRDHLRAVRVFSGRVELRAQGAPPRVLVAGERWEIELAKVDDAPPFEEVTAAEPVAIAAEPRKPARRSERKQRQQLSAKQDPAPPIARAKRPIELLFEEGWAKLAAGEATAAAAIFERAARSSPNDPLAEDAWFWQASSLARAKSGSAAGALDAFLTRYPSSPRAGEASAMLGWLVIDRDLDRAEKLFNAAASDRVASVRASATKGLDVVERRRAKE